MSSSFPREPLTAIIRQENIVVGAICLPEEASQEFIEEFNYCYGALRLRIEPLDTGSVRKMAATSGLRPVGAGYRRSSPPPPADAGAST